MQNHLLSIPERVFVEEARANTRDKVAYMKLSVLVMLDEGLSQEMVSTLLGIGLGTVNNCKKKYDSAGLERYLDRHYVPYQGKLSDEQLAVLDLEVSNRLYGSCAEVGLWIKEKYGIIYSEGAIRAILAKLGFVYKKTSEVPGKVDIGQQEAFLKEMEPFMAEVADDEVIYFMDAMHPQHNTRADYAWIKRGEEHPIPTNCGRRRININGAMNAQQPEEVVIIEAESINAQATIALGEKLLEKHRDKAKIYVFCDNAPYYTCSLLREWLQKNPQLELLHLPPYSPNLNLIERLWKFLRKKVINLQFYPHFKDFRAAIFHFFANLKQYKEELHTLMQPNFQRFSMHSKT